MPILMTIDEYNEHSQAVWLHSIAWCLFREKQTTQSNEMLVFYSSYKTPSLTQYLPYFLPLDIVEMQYQAEQLISHIAFCIYLQSVVYRKGNLACSYFPTDVRAL